MKNLHYGHCLVGVAAAVIVLVVLGVKVSTLGFLAVVLVCPLLMFVMMRMMMGDRAVHSPSGARSDRSPER
jgi:hypothetical protein